MLRNEEDKIGLDIKREMDKANKIISAVKEDIQSAIESMKNDDYGKAIRNIERGLSRTDCPVCHLELGVLKADIVHNEAICHLGSELCEDEKSVIIERAKLVAKEFTPLKD